MNRSRLLPLLSFLLLLAACPDLSACGGHHRYRRHRAGIRACFANQKTIAGAIEMYNLDYGTDVKVLDASLREKLVEDGYLQQFPDDPGEGGPEAYLMIAHAAVGNGILCLNHGTLQVGEDFRDRAKNTNARSVLEACGITDPALLERARTSPPTPPWNWIRLREAGQLAPMASLILLSPFGAIFAPFLLLLP